MGNGISRRRFVKTIGVANLAVGVGALGGGALGVEAAGVNPNRSLIGAVKLDPTEAYGDVPILLESYIKQNDAAAWGLLMQRINYIHDHIGHSVLPVLKKKDLMDQIKAEITAGRKLFFKPNIVSADVLSVNKGDGSPGLTTGVVATTNWPFLAALMRFFHDQLGIRYYQMAVGEAGVTTPIYSTLLKCTPEALLEGCLDGATRWSGYPFYFVRKYLAEATAALDPLDDPTSGYEDSISGTYITPGEATHLGKLIMYELNDAEKFDRGRLVLVPDGGDNYPEGIIIHKALVGDPSDPSNYPGSVLVNCPVLKVHTNSIITNAIKNLGIGGWPMRAGRDSDPDTPDWLYAYPHDDPPGIKGGVPGGPNKAGVYHARWYVRKANDEGMPLKIAEAPNRGLDGTMVDINLAIKSQVPHILHVVDAIRPINFDHTGGGNGVALDEGLVFTSEDPVAVDLLCARYLFTNTPTFERSLPIPHYDRTKGAIVTDSTVMDARVARSKLFSYSAYRKLGQLDYYVEGVDFENVMTREFYYDIVKILWDLQPTVLAHAQATDALTKDTLKYNPGYYGEFMALDENGDGVIDDTESGKDGAWDCLCAIGGYIYHSLTHTGPHAQSQAMFVNASRMLKYSNKAWNVDISGGTGQSVDTTRILLDTAFAFNNAFNMANGKPGTDTFFNIPYGTGAGGVVKWPSLQYARYIADTSTIRQLHKLAEETNQRFTLFVPDSVPHFPSASYNPDGLPNIVEISNQMYLPSGKPNPKYDPDFAEKVFTAWFDSGEKWH